MIPGPESPRNDEAVVATVDKMLSDYFARYLRDTGYCRELLVESFRHLSFVLHSIRR